MSAVPEEGATKALIVNRGASSALKLLDETPQQQKGLAAVVLQRNWALLALGNKPEARKGIDQVLAVRKLPDALLQEAVLKMDQKDYAGARAAAEEVLGQRPEDTRALRLVLESYTAQKQLAQGMQRVRAHAAAQPKWCKGATVPRAAFSVQPGNGGMKRARRSMPPRPTARAGARRILHWRNWT
jgi:tetratricopeptide (TPR) repeat protein